MKISRPSHTTVVAYLALFAALGGTAIAARNDTGAKELKHLNVRENRQVVTAEDPNLQKTVIARCHRREQFISGAGGWDRNDVAVTSSTSFLRTSRRGPALGLIVRASRPPGYADTLVAQALCLPK